MSLEKLANIVHKGTKKIFLSLVMVSTFYVAYDMYKNPKSWKDLEDSYANTEHYMLEGRFFQDYQRAIERPKKRSKMKKILYKQLISRADQNNNHILEQGEQIDCIKRLGIKPEIYFESQRRIIPLEKELDISQIAKAVKTYKIK